MGNILNYVKKYGNKTLNEVEYNNIDNVIFAILSYVDFDGIVDPKNNKIRIEDAGDKFFSKYTNKDIKNNITGIRSAIKIFKNVYKENRYKDLLLYNYTYKGDETKQFSAIFIDLDDKLTYVSFEGTDELVSGWREDAELAYLFPVPAQKDAIEYLNKNISIFSNRKYIIGGHSKGGNLALVAAMYANPLIRLKIKSVIMNDGPGVRKAQIESKNYKKVQKKLLKIIPNYSIVGLLLRHTDDFCIVESNKTGIMAHNVLSWQIDDNKFIETKLSTFSKKVDKTITNWLDNYDDTERKEFIDDLFSVLSRAGVFSLLDIKITSLPKIMSIIKESGKINAKTKNMISVLVKFALNYLKEDNHNSDN